MKPIKNIFFLLLITINTVSPCAEVLMNHYYLVTRLKDAVALLHKVPKKIIAQLPLEQLGNPHDKHVAHCVNKIKKEKNLCGLFSYWHKIITYSIETNDTSFVEFATLICKLCMLIKIKTIYPPSKAQSALDTIIAMGNLIDQLPISEILNTIDMLVNELPAFLEKYEFNSAMTWKIWLKRYWWIPPVVIVWFGLKILLNFQHKQHGYFGYYTTTHDPHEHYEPIETDDPVLTEIIIEKRSKYKPRIHFS